MYANKYSYVVHNRDDIVTKCIEIWMIPTFDVYTLRKLLEPGFPPIIFEGAGSLDAGRGRPERTPGIPDAAVVEADPIMAVDLEGGLSVLVPLIAGL